MRLYLSIWSMLNFMGSPLCLGICSSTPVMVGVMAVVCGIGSCLVLCCRVIGKKAGSCSISVWLILEVRLFKGWLMVVEILLSLAALIHFCNKFGLMP